MDADQQTVGLDEPFSVYGQEGDSEEDLQFPGDPDGSDGNVINCACGIGYANAAGEEVSEEEAEGEAGAAAPELTDEQTSQLADLFDTLASGTGQLTHDEAAAMSGGIDDILTPEEEAEEAAEEAKPTPAAGRKPVVPPPEPEEEEPEEGQE